MHDGGVAVDAFCAADDLFLCDDKITCIPRHWVCDERVDCPDNSDRSDEFCGNVSCSFFHIFVSLVATGAAQPGWYCCQQCPFVTLSVCPDVCLST